jgi:DNA (cytosine-5)-methyltransferase 1
LFCGAGGASLGLHRAGYDVVGYDHWARAVETHLANGLPAHVHDLSDPDIDHLLPECDLLWASPPCQPFSAAGDQAGEFDDRDGFPWLLRIVARLLPPVCIVENVAGLTHRPFRDYFGRVLEQFHDLGYTFQWRVLNSADYGVPQTRERCFIVARRDDGPIVWPAPTHTQGFSLFLEPWVTMAQALGWHEQLSYRRGEGMIERHGERGPWDTTTIPAPTVHRNSAKDWLIGSAPPAITRAPLICELATLQGFPPDWQWCGTKTDQALQIANAVPPVMAERLAAANRPTGVPA